jgi:hypothetical protein
MHPLDAEIGVIFPRFKITEKSMVGIKIKITCISRDARDHVRVSLFPAVLDEIRCIMQ